MIITVTNQKGGVAKTTTAVALATAANRPDHYLLADLDPQGHCAIALGLDPDPGIYNTIVGGHTIYRNHVGRCCLIRGNSRTKLIIPRTDDQPVGFNLPDRLRWLHKEWAAQNGEYLILDTAAQGALQEAAITVADHIVIPVRPELLAVDGLNATLALIERLNPTTTYTILPVQVDRRLREHTTILDLLKENYPDAVGPAVPARIAVAEAVASGQTIWDYPSRQLADVRTAYCRTLARILRHFPFGETDLGDCQS
jgi:chromosome partitioning protein